MAVYAVRDAVGRLENVQSLATPWINGLKIHAAVLPLAEFTGTIGNLRGARFGRDSAWRAMACFGALDEFRHTQIPLMHELVRWNPTNNWFRQESHLTSQIATFSADYLCAMGLQSASWNKAN
jgi:toluene monooxygenase system protein A